MSDTPPKEGSYLPPDEGPSPEPRRRGIRAGKSAKRKREAYLRKILELNPTASPDLLSVVHVGGTSRPLFTPRNWVPTYSSDEEAEEPTAEGESEFVDVVVEEETPETPAPKAAPRLVPKEPSYPPPGYTAKAKARLTPTPKVPSSTSSTGAGSSTDRPKPTIAPEVSSSSSSGPPVVVAPSQAPLIAKAPPGVRAPPPKPTARTTRLAPSNIPPPEPKVPPKAKAILKPAAPVKSAVPVRPAEPAGPPPKGKDKGSGKGKGKSKPPGELVNIGRGFLVDPGTFQRVDLTASTSQQVVSSILAIDFHNVLDRTFIRQGRRTVVEQQEYPHQRHALLPAVVAWLTRIARLCNEQKVLLVLCSHIGERSEAIESHALSVLRNSTQDSSSDLFDLWIITRFRTERGGKLWSIQTLFPGSGPIAIIDDNVSIIRELESANQRGFHIRLPKREGTGARSYDHIYDATADVERWIVENGGDS